MSRCLTRSLIAIASLALSVSGCAPEAQRYIRFPQVYNPGPAPVQRAEAVVHDPYPLNDVAPEIVGGRPLSYQNAVPEVERARMYDNSRRAMAFQPQLPAGWQAPPGAVVTGPPVPAGTPVVTGSPVVGGPGVVTSPPVVSGPPVMTSAPGASLPPPPPAMPVAPPVGPPMTSPNQIRPRSPY